jgi:hypothetical protein
MIGSPVSCLKRRIAGPAWSGPGPWPFGGRSDFRLSEWTKKLASSYREKRSAARLIDPPDSSGGRHWHRVRIGLVAGLHRAVPSTSLDKDIILFFVEGMLAHSSKWCQRRSRLAPDGTYASLRCELRRSPGLRATTAPSTERSVRSVRIGWRKGASRFTV